MNASGHVPHQLHFVLAPAADGQTIVGLNHPVQLCQLVMMMSAVRQANVVVKQVGWGVVEPAEHEAQVVLEHLQVHLWAWVSSRML